MIEQGIFAESLLETSWAQRTRRSWTTLTSFGLEALAIGILLVVPLWKTVGLPSAHSLSTPISLGRPTVEPSAPRPRSGPGSTDPTTFIAHTLMQPRYIPSTVTTGVDEPAPELPPGGDLGVQGTRQGIPNGLFSTDGVRPVAPPPPATVVRTFRTSTMQEGNLIRRVQPAYPSLARAARIQGPVVLEAVISKAGVIENLRVLSGHPMLAPAAIDAVSQWRYLPYILNNEPVEVETQITVNFVLGGS